MLTSGARLGPYEVLSPLGAGGMGEVYRAHDAKLDRDVALKVLPQGSLADEAARKRFRKEALALSRLSHPHIASLFDFDTTDDGTDFLVMELVTGPRSTPSCGASRCPRRRWCGSVARSCARSWPRTSMASSTATSSRGT